MKSNSSGIAPIRLWIGVTALLFASTRFLPAGASVDYLREVKPILARNCFSCHGAKVQMSGLRLDTGAAMLKGSMSGPVVVPGKSVDSLLIKAVTGAGGAVLMPFNKPPLAGSEIEVLKSWIDQGASAPAGEKPEDGMSAPTHWSFVAPVRPGPPAIKNQQWVRNDVDRFILARLEKEGISPSPEAGRATLARRLYLDLLGFSASIE